MADKRISEFDDARALTGDELAGIVQGAGTSSKSVKVPLRVLKTYITQDLTFKSNTVCY
jgi:hypothetical protein